MCAFLTGRVRKHADVFPLAHSTHSVVLIKSSCLEFHNICRYLLHERGPLYFIESPPNSP